MQFVIVTFLKVSERIFAFTHMPYKKNNFSVLSSGIYKIKSQTKKSFFYLLGIHL